MFKSNRFVPSCLKALNGELISIQMGITTYWHQADLSMKLSTYQITVSGESISYQLPRKVDVI